MSKLVYKSPGGRFTVEFSYDSQKSLFEQLAEFQEIFEEDTCGACGGTDVKFSVREVDENKYYEMKCSCGAALSYGQNKKGNTLFPKRKNAAGEWDYETQGWKKWADRDPEDKPEPKAKKTK